MPSSFNVQHASGYEQLMGRWSKTLAPEFIQFTGAWPGDRVLDVGCGNGSLTFALAENPRLRDIAAIDYSSVFVEETRRLNDDPRITVEEADACALPFSDDRFDAAMALLVLHFVPDAVKAVSEMCRVVRPGGLVASAVWDHYGGMPSFRLMLDTMAMMDEAAEALRRKYCWQPFVRQGEMKAAFIASGLRDVEETSLLIRLNYASFDDYWTPVASGEGPLGRYVSTLAEAPGKAVEAAVRSAYEAGEPDGPRSFAAVAWACKGTVPA